MQSFGRNLRDRVVYGSTPPAPAVIRAWVPVGYEVVRGYCEIVGKNDSHPAGHYEFRDGTDEERRMFLLFVCEAEQE